MFENRELRKIYGSKIDEVIGEWRRLHKKELYKLNVFLTVHHELTVH